MTQLQFDGAVAVITGSGGGIGRSMAQAFAKRGTRIVITDIEPDAAERVAAELRDAGGTAIAIPCDVTDPHSVAALRDGTLEAYGTVDILCNNAGATIRPFRAMEDGSLADFRFMMDINFYGVVNGLLTFLPVMFEREGRKHIVNTSSMSTLDGVVGHSMYISAKSAVNALSEVLRAELEDQGKDIGLTVLMPGQVATRISTSERLRPEDDRSEGRGVREYRRNSAMKRPPISPDGVGDLVAEAILADQPYCMTHEPPAEQMYARVEKEIAGYRPLADAATGATR